MPKTTMFNQRMHELQHQVVRDLAWCCFSAPMMQGLPGSDAIILPFNNDQLWPWLNSVDQQPDKLLKEIANVKSTRLGVYYETLWHFYFSHHPEWELLHHNLQVERKGITLGAFDFLCRRGSEYWHIEAAVKFYLCNATSPAAAQDWHHWIGPSSNDRLDLKLARMQQHQLPLHKTLEARALLQTLYPDAQGWKTGLCMQGYLFSPAATNCNPAFSHDAHGKGNWYYLSNFLQLQGDHASLQWIIVERRQWLSPAHIDDETVLTQSADLVARLEYQVGEMKRPLLLAALKKANPTDKSWQEDRRAFVVPDTWPNQE